MNSFNVLDRSQNIHHSYLLEASAGTGKTFSIENIVVRLLIEGDNPLSIDKILVVTFTKAATRDLKIRIREAIHNCLLNLDQSSAEAYDYLKVILEQGDEAVSIAKKRLDEALFCFDQAQIFTIHGFCFRMLRQNIFEGDFSFDAMKSEESIRDDELLKMIRDFLRSKLNTSICHPVQLEIVLRKHKNKLDRPFLKSVKEGYDILPGPTYNQSFDKFIHAMKVIKQHGFESDKIIADYEKMLPFYIKTDLEDQFDIQDFAHLFTLNQWTHEEFNRLIKNELYYLRKFSPEKLKKNRKNPPAPHELQIPNFYDVLNEHLWPIIREASAYEMIYSRLAFECQEMVRNYLKDNEKMVFGDFLECMAKALEQPAFCEHVQNKFQAAVIDEFQDTDPVQWEIFKRLFLSNGKFLYLVGDPKQSIYAFRRADIYTYRDAALAIPSEYHGCLDTNYRSQPSLIKALNQLFASAKDFIELPRAQTILEFHPVKASPKALDKTFDDDRGSLHFIVSEKKDAEQNEILPFVLNEIQEINRQGIAFKQIAVLVKDRFQADRFATLCNKYHLPVALQKRGQLSESPLIPNLQEILKAALHPKNLSHVKVALASGLIGCTHLQVKELSNLNRLEKILAQFYYLRQKLIEEGFSSFYFALLNSCWHDNGLTAREGLLTQHGGGELLDELDQIAALLMDHQAQTHCIPEALIKFLTDLRETSTQDEESVKKEADSQRDAIQVLSMHSSKGLEFDIVFALGLSANSPEPGLLIPVPHGTKQCLKAVEPHSPEYIAHCREIDAEKMRQLYVAMTRAKFRLYIPVIMAEKTKQSIMDLFLKKLSIQSTASLVQFVESRRPSMSYSLLQDEICLKPLQNKSDLPELFEPIPVSIPGSQRYMQSYTSMTKRFAAAELQLPVRDVKPPRQFEVEMKTAHNLPAGAETGILLHKIFENIPLDCCRNIKGLKELHALIRPFVNGTKYESWLEVVSEIIYKSLTASLGSFRLTDIEPEQCYREVEFLYPTENGFMKGVIDLVFQYEGLYYIVDWKSNWLGAADLDYSSEKMKQAMSEHDYFLQKEIYINAWKKYVNVAAQTTFENCFGGVFYFFVRGISGKTGVYKA